MFLTSSLPRSLMTVPCYGRVRKVYILLNSMIFRGGPFTTFMSLSDTTGMDILGFDRKLIKIAGHNIADSLLDIINDSFSSGLFPEDWKLARVTPVFNNNGDVDVMSNYRPISVIGHIAKMVEHLVRTQLVNYLEEHSFITPDQSAYLKGHPTQTNLHRVIDDCLENINETQITGACLLDIYNFWLGSKVTKSCSTTNNGEFWLYKLSWDWPC